MRWHTIEWFALRTFTLLCHTALATYVVTSRLFAEEIAFYVKKTGTLNYFDNNAMKIGK